VRAELATATSERVRASRLTLEVARVRITEVGRQALSGGDKLLNATHANFHHHQ
jgi:hypothetical protein